MVNYNLGSISTNIYTRIENIPTTVSGQMIAIVDEERLYVEQYTGQSIGSTSIAEKWQPVITDLATAKVLNLMNLTGADVNSITLGDLSINKGGESNLIKTAEYYEKLASDKLKSLGRATNFKRVIG
jgi:hypothetical protein